MTELVVVAVVVARLLIPLGIPKYPLPSILAALVIDGVDQTIFQAIGATSFLDSYQDHDKALDVYYLTIAYTSTLRNWLDPTALAIARFLFYYRLVGTLVFELTDERILLVVFPNTFEYFFIFYESVRLFWNPSRMSRSLLLSSAAGIWILVKLPQEYWIHVARLDVTDEQARHPWLLPAFLAACTVLLAVAARSRSRLPPRDRTPSLDVDAHLDRPASCAVVPRRDRNAILSMAVLEKVLLLSATAVIFSQVLHGVRASTAQVAVGVTAVVAVNAAISLWRIEHGSRYGSTLMQVAAMAVINAGIVGLGVLVRRSAGVSAYLPAQDALAYLLLISMIIAMYDRYRVIGNLSSDRPSLLGRRMRLRRRCDRIENSPTGAGGTP